MLASKSLQHCLSTGDEKTVFSIFKKFFNGANRVMSVKEFKSLEFTTSDISCHLVAKLSVTLPDDIIF